MRRIALLALALVVLAATTAAAAEPPALGYWSKTTPPLALPVQPPGLAPEGGGWVAADPSGPASVTAVRAIADTGRIVVGLQLAIADEVGATDVVGCPTLERWAVTQGGRAEAAPLADCATPLAARVAAGRLVIDLPAALQGEVVDLLLTPAEGAAFSLTLHRPTAASLVQASAPLPVEDPPRADEPLFPVPVPGAGPIGPGPPLASAPALPGPAVPAPTPLLPAGRPPSVAVPVLAPSAAATEDRTGSLLAVAVLAALVALAMRLSTLPVTTPRRLGGVARLIPTDPAEAGEERGVGRFRSPRQRPPVRL